MFDPADFIFALAIGWTAYDIVHGRFAVIDAVLAVCIVTRVAVLLLEFRLRRLAQRIARLERLRQRESGSGAEFE